MVSVYLKNTKQNKKENSADRTPNLRDALVFTKPLNIFKTILKNESIYKFTVCQVSSEVGTC